MPFPEDAVPLKQNCIQVTGGNGWTLRYGLCTPSYELISEVNKPSCDGLSKVGTAPLRKVVAVSLSGWHLTTGHAFIP